MHLSVFALLAILYAQHSAGSTLGIVDVGDQCMIWSNGNHGCTGHSSPFALPNEEDCSSKNSKIINLWAVDWRISRIGRSSQWHQPRLANGIRRGMQYSRGPASGVDPIGKDRSGHLFQQARKHFGLYIEWRTEGWQHVQCCASRSSLESVFALKKISALCQPKFSLMHRFSKWNAYETHYVLPAFWKPLTKRDILAVAQVWPFRKTARRSMIICVICFSCVRNTSMQFSPRWWKVYRSAKFRNGPKLT